MRGAQYGSDYDLAAVALLIIGMVAGGLLALSCDSYKRRHPATIRSIATTPERMSSTS